MAKGPQVGDQAPDFELVGTDGTFRLSDHRGERVVLLFYPGDETPVCTKQFCSYRDRADDMAQLDATVVGISTQDLDSHKSFIENHGLTVPLLADPEKKAVNAFGVKGPFGAQRAVIIVDENGIVRHRHVHKVGLTFQSVDDIKEALAGLGEKAASA
jgi:peroxiredoxin Q/BCP